VAAAQVESGLNPHVGRVDIVGTRAIPVHRDDCHHEADLPGCAPSEPGSGATATSTPVANGMLDLFKDIPVKGVVRLDFCEELW
jgi:hypothetical protein